jgi:hypothetical protein
MKLTGSVLEINEGFAFFIFRSLLSAAD